MEILSLSGFVNWVVGLDVKPKPSRATTGLYRICETNDIYDCGWIFVTNEIDIDEAIQEQEKWEKRCPNLVYTIVAI